MQDESAGGRVDVMWFKEESKELHHTVQKQNKYDHIVYIFTMFWGRADEI